jgi:hypothetical protein
MGIFQVISGPSPARGAQGEVLGRASLERLEDHLGTARRMEGPASSLQRQTLDDTAHISK